MTVVLVRACTVVTRRARANRRRYQCGGGGGRRCRYTCGSGCCCRFRFGQRRGRQKGKERGQIRALVALGRCGGRDSARVSATATATATTVVIAIICLWLKRLVVFIIRPVLPIVTTTIAIFLHVTLDLVIAIVDRAAIRTTNPGRR